MLLKIADTFHISFAKLQAKIIILLIITNEFMFFFKIAKFEFKVRVHCGLWTKHQTILLFRNMRIDQYILAYFKTVLKAISHSYLYHVNNSNPSVVMSPNDSKTGLKPARTKLQNVTTTGSFCILGFRH